MTATRCYERAMTTEERDAFIRRRKDEWASWPITVTGASLLVGVLFTLLIGVVFVGACWLVYWLSGSVGVFDVMLTGWSVVCACGGLLAAWMFVSGIVSLRTRCRLPEDAVVRVLEGEPLNAVAFEQEYGAEPLVRFELAGVGLMRVHLADPPEGKLVRTDENVVRVAWSPLRRYYVEWVEVPRSWAEGLERGGDADQSGLWFASLPSLEEVREKLGTAAGSMCEPGDVV